MWGCVCVRGVNLGVCMCEGCTVYMCDDTLYYMYILYLE